MTRAVNLAATRLPRCDRPREYDDFPFYASPERIRMTGFARRDSFRRARLLSLAGTRIDPFLRSHLKFDLKSSEQSSDWPIASQVE